jgi:hypothetical protein
MVILLETPQEVDPVQSHLVIPRPAHSTHHHQRAFLQQATLLLGKAVSQTQSVQAAPVDQGVVAAGHQRQEGHLVPHLHGLGDALFVGQVLHLCRRPLSPS